LQGKAAKSAAGDASAAQLAAAQMSVAEQRRQFNQMRKLLQPYVGAGNTALTAQLNLMGLGGQRATSNAVNRLRNSDRFDRFGQRDRMNAIDRLKGSDAFKGMDEEAQAEALKKLRGSDRFQGFGDDQRQAAIKAIKEDPRFSNKSLQQRAINQIRQGPQFQTMVEAGENAILGNASVTGGLRGGNTQRALAEFRPQVLNQLIGQQLGNLGGLATMGQNSAAGVGNAGMQVGANIGNTYGQMGAAQAGAALAAGQANANMFGGIAGSVGNVMGQMMPKGGMPAGAGLFDSWGF
jgi:hypothetical protein